MNDFLRSVLSKSHLEYFSNKSYINLMLRDPILFTLNFYEETKCRSVSQYLILVLQGIL